MRLPGSPGLHFLVSGACLFALVRAWPTPVEPLVLERARVEALAADWAAATGEAPDPREAEALVEAAIDEELLLREAYARGLAERDPVVRARLARNARFLGEGAPEAEEEELAETMRALGLERGDRVVRRRLVERMRAALEAEAEPPTEAEIRARLARYPSLRDPDRVRLVHEQMAREPEASRVEALLLDLAPSGSGQTILFGTELAPRSERELAAEFGADFARAVFALPVGRWFGPVASAYGAHRVYVKERIPGALRSEAVLRPRIEAELREEHARAALRAGLARLRARQPIRVAELAP